MSKQMSNFGEQSNLRTRNNLNEMRYKVPKKKNLTSVILDKIIPRDFVSLISSVICITAF